MLASPRNHGRRTGDSEDVSDESWFGMYSINVVKESGATKANEAATSLHGRSATTATAAGTVRIRPKPAAARRVAFGSFQEPAALQVARDAVALLLARMPATFSDAPVNTVHLLTMAVVDQCCLTIETGDRLQPMILLPVYMYCAVRAYREQYSDGNASKAVGYGAGQHGCVLMAVVRDALPDAMWSSVRPALSVQLSRCTAVMTPPQTQLCTGMA